MAQTLVEKIVEAHMTSAPSAGSVRAGDFVVVRPRHVMTHDNTSPVIAKFQELGAKRVADPAQPVFTLDHDIQNQSPANLRKYEKIERFAAEQGIAFFPAGTGIGHQVMCEHLHVLPGSLVVASDSHSNMYGALGALGTPVVRTDAAAIWATGEFWWQIPETVQVVLSGELPAGVTGKDLILTLASQFDQGEVLNRAIEFAGSGVASLSMDARMTVANMTTEWGSLTGWFPVDETTLGYLEQRREALGATAGDRLRDAQLAGWRQNPPQPDDGANYAGRIELDLATVGRQLAGPDSVQRSQALSALAPERIPIHKAYLVSCVNSRLEDLQAAAAVLNGHHVADSVKFYVAAASRQVQKQAEDSGAWQTLLDAGAISLPAGCGPCIGLGSGLLEAGEVGISATNRNFRGRLGSRDAQAYLASPETVAAAAIAGYVERTPTTAPETVSARYQSLQTGNTSSAQAFTTILEGFPPSIQGRVLFLPADNLNTDGIYGKDYTYRDDMTPEMMAKVVMENYDPEFAAMVRAGDIVVAGENFGTGSSREQAATSLRAAGIALVVAASFSQTYLRNAFNNGIPCVTCPGLVDSLRKSQAAAIEAGQRTVVAGSCEVLFESSLITLDHQSFSFPQLGEVPQRLVVERGLAGWVGSLLAARRS